jgi:hypothetical protein
MSKMMGLELISYDIIPIVNYGWSGSFANTTNNVKAILERGWNPLNRMLLLHPDLRKTMTDRDLKDELESGLFPVNKMKQQQTESEVSNINTSIPTMRNNINSTTNNDEQVHLQSLSLANNLNMQGTTTKQYIKKLVKESDFEEAREQIIEDKKEGIDLRERLFKMPRATAAQLVITGQTHTLGQHLLDYVEERVTIKREEKKRKELQDIRTYQKQRKEHDEAISRNTGKLSIMDWTVEDIKSVLKLEKTKEDGAMPKTKKDLAELYAKCMARKGDTVVLNYVPEPVTAGIDTNTQESVEESTLTNDDMKTSI